ncbi:MAG: hypothetical protein JW717_14975 [Marinilabiliaceae bacterium]|nr:hypothetical protein [Marinilabiliaceae bacterium]
MEIANNRTQTIGGNQD